MYAALLWLCAQRLGHVCELFGRPSLESVRKNWALGWVMGNEFLTPGSLAQRLFMKHSWGQGGEGSLASPNTSWSQRPVPALVWVVRHVTPCSGLTALCLCFQIT